jgi:large subunit ribosomal protein L29
MKIKEIRDLSISELTQKNNELIQEVFKLRIRHASGQLEQTAMLTRLRKDIARVNTVMKEKEAVI